MKKLYEGGEVSHLMYVISQGPNHRARVFNGCVTNVFLFRAPDIEKNLTTQNNDVLVKGDDSTSNMAGMVCVEKLSHYNLLVKRSHSI
jgi:hypothetical protein